MTGFRARESARLCESRGAEELPGGDGGAGHRAGAPLAREDHVELYLRRLFLPLERRDGIPIVATADESVENIAWLRAAYPSARIVGVSNAWLLGQLLRRYRDALSGQAVLALARELPELSAMRVVTRTQSLVLLLGAALIGVLIILWPAEFLQDSVFGISILFWGMVFFRAVLALLGAKPAVRPKWNATPDKASLPAYTVIVPLFREANMLSSLSRFLLALDYPRDRLQLILAVEDDDAETADAAEALARQAPFEIVRVPPSTPRTKPKDANFALRFARGEFVVIYDAEDQPECDQLLKAVAQFRREPRATGCLQARLSFFNAGRWITKQASLDYAVWFGHLLPGLERLGLPIPLGGTSNHFRTSILRAICAWDPFNVTEDADIGIRLAALGYRVAMLDSTTHEEAPERIGAWIKQRSRWLKGYTQTWLVHSRCMPRFLRTAGFGSVLAFHLFIGGTVLSALLNPLLWIVFLFIVFSGPDGPGDPLACVSGASLIVSNGLLTILAMAGSRSSGDPRLAPHGLMVAAYWLLVSIAAYRGLWHLFTRPFHWEKTAHGLNPAHGVRHG